MRTLLALWREPVLKRPVLVIESDDWGAGPVEQGERLERIAKLLASHSNRRGEKPVMTLGAVLSVADGGRIVSGGLRHYYRRSLDDPAFAPVLRAMKRGCDDGVFALQLHGEEHYWPQALLSAAKTDPAVAAWVRASEPPSTEALPAGLQSRWIDAAELPSKPLPAAETRAAAQAEVAAFSRIFGKTPKVAVPPTFVWNEAVEAGWAAAGVEVVITPGRRYEARDKDGKPVATGPAIVNGQKSAAGTTYLVRDEYFEPARGHTAERALAGLAARARLGRPTLLETHRANFMGDPRVAEAAMKELDRLIAAALRAFPEVLFTSAEELALRMRRRDPQLVEQRLARRLRVWLRRLLTMLRPA
jgi:hypothetical protein